MAITAKVRNKQIDTGKVLHALVQGEHASGNITFQIIGEEELVEDFNSTYFYLLYTRPSDTRPNVLLLTNKQLQDDVISVTFKPTSYFTAEDGTVQIQIMATDTEGLSIDSETGTISGSVIWQTFPGAMFVHASQLTGTETIIEENVLTQYLAGMQELYSQTEDAEGDAADSAQLAKAWASKTNGAVEGGEMSAKYYAGTADSRAKEAEGYAVGTVSGSPSASFAGKNAKELASDAQDWAKGTRSDGKTPSHTSDNAKAYAESAADSAAIVSAHAEAIDAIGDDLTNIDAVAADILDDDSAIDAVAANITNVNAVAANETNINAVNTNKTNINTVAGKATEITTVAGIASDVSAVAAIASDVAAVEDIDDDVSAVAAIAVDVGVVADAATDVAAVADGITAVGTVATNISDVGAVASDITKIAAVADDLTNIDAVADDLANIDAAEANALKAEGWANGTQNGTDVGSTSPYYHNNAKYWAGSVPALQSKVEANSKRITNLEHKAGDEIVVDYPSSTYGMDEVPANVAEYAKVSKLRGVSRVDNNLIPTNRNTGSYTASADTSSYDETAHYLSSTEIQCVSGHTYLMVANVTRNISTNNQLSLIMWPKNMTGNASVVFANGESNGQKCSLYTANGNGYFERISLNNYNGKRGFNAGDSASYSDLCFKDLNIYFNTTDLSFLGSTDSAKLATIQTNYPHLLIPSEYGVRIVDSSYSGVRAWAKNLCNYKNFENKNILTEGQEQPFLICGCSVDYIPVKANSAMVFSANMALNGVRIAEYDADKNFIRRTDGAVSDSFTTTGNTRFVRWIVNYNGSTTVTEALLKTLDLQLEYGSSRTTFSEYREPSTLSLTFNGKSAGSVYDSCEPNVEVGGVARKRTTTRVNSKNLGNIDWSADGAYGTASTTFSAWLEDCKNYTSAQLADALCSVYKVVTNDMLYTTDVPCLAIVGSGSYQRIRVNDPSKSGKTGAQFKADMSGVLLYYALATESVTLSDPILDPFIQVEGGGTIRPIQTQTPEIDSAMTAEYLSV